MADTEALTRNYIDAINRRDWDTVAGLLDHDSIHHYAGGEASGPAGIVEVYKMLSEQMGWQIVVHDIASTDSWAATLHRNEFSDGSFEVCTSARLRDGKVVEMWTVGMPPPPAA
ncbi:MAG TPA: nuclear transport factor 2 family protein [Acidimicrobiales bacterium]|nr:nuclear transport factor 2 family protein [Acidimicrobiales bacterium]